MPKNLLAPNVLMVFPRFNPNSFWSLAPVCEAWGARCPAPPLGLITLAAMLPPGWNMRLINCNSEELTPAELGWADLVMTGGMLPQQDDTLALIELAHAHAKPVVVGGPDATSSPDAYRTADFLVLGEAEVVIQDFIKAWSSGVDRGVFEAPKFTVDVTTTPIPRFDLLKFDHYLYIGVQFSRGCPFNCEFCDIIELYGRVPRAKSNAQMLAELDALHATGYRGHVDFVDDNLIGNKKALKRFLPELAAWQKAHRYPFEFTTEASMNLADDRELLMMLREANFIGVFVGIESPDPETLIATQKKQNTRRSLADSVHRINAAGLYVIAGFIVGFDTERSAVADTMIDCIEATGIPVAMVGLLTALPNTQLTRRLMREGRLLPFKGVAGGGDQCTSGLNFVTLRPRRDVLMDFRTILASIYEPTAYFARVRRLGRALDRPQHASAIDWRIVGKELRALARILWTMNVKRPDLRSHFWATIMDCLRHQPRNFEAVLTMSVMYLHLGAFSKVLIAGLDQQIAELDAAPAPEVPLLPAA